MEHLVASLCELLAVEFHLNSRIVEAAEIKNELLVLRRQLKSISFVLRDLSKPFIHKPQQNEWNDTFISHNFLDTKMVSNKFVDCFGYPSNPAGDVDSHKTNEIKKISLYFDEYALFCMQQEISAEKLMIVNFDVGKGLVELIPKNHVSKLVKGSILDLKREADATRWKTIRGLSRFSFDDFSRKRDGNSDTPDNKPSENFVMETKKCEGMTEGKTLKALEKAENKGLWGEFSLKELLEASNNFDASLKIGVGGFGTVYKGFMGDTPVAIKVLNVSVPPKPHSSFFQEGNILGRVRHPNLVTLLGFGREMPSLVYEYMPFGNLEDRLICKDNTRPLSWQQRIKIAADICKALVFLHSFKPPIIHGDLKPQNILLDVNCVAKISDFGMSELSHEANDMTTFFGKTHPCGTYAYIDPEYIMTGKKTPSSDIYSFGMVILHLVTGRSAFGLANDVKEALKNNSLNKIMDKSAGKWPMKEMEELASVAIRCCEIMGKNRPNLNDKVWNDVVEKMEKCILGTQLFSSLLSLESAVKEFNPPSYFICPIFQDIMRDPVIAADGFTYEAEAIKKWLDSGRTASPMTNLELPHCDLIPNHALRSAIKEWILNQATT